MAEGTRVVIFCRIYQQLFTAENLIYKNITALYTESIPFLVEGKSAAPGLKGCYQPCSCRHHFHDLQRNIHRLMTTTLILVIEATKTKK
jgi:hypothetical protein